MRKQLDARLPLPTFSRLYRFCSTMDSVVASEAIDLS